MEEERTQGDQNQRLVLLLKREKQMRTKEMELGREEEGERNMQYMTKYAITQSTTDKQLEKREG